MADSNNANGETKQMANENGNAAAAMTPELAAALAFIEQNKQPMSLSMPGKLWLAVNAFHADPKVSARYATVQEMCMHIIARGIKFDDPATMALAKGKRQYTPEQKAALDAEKKAIRATAIEQFRNAQNDANKSEQVNALRGWLASKDQQDAAGEPLIPATQLG